MNPTLNDHQSLLINSKTNKSDLSILLDSCEEYMLSADVAQKIIAEVTEAVKSWRTLATKLGISKKEIHQFEGVFDSVFFEKKDFLHHLHHYHP